MKKIYFVSLIFITCMVLSCDKDNSDILKDNGVLSWTGDYAVDGCGFFITIDNNKYKPENESIIDDSYKTVDDINVLVEYEILNKKVESYCGDIPNATLTDGIKIIWIQKK